jgi:spore germination cell wall hydrolase CwlJ-like protein
MEIFKPKTGLILAFILLIALTLHSSSVWWNAKHIDEYQKIALVEVAILTKKSAAVNPEYLKCLATNIYWEAGGEPFMGQVAVARVVMNRVKHGFGPNPCRVIYQKTTVPDLDNPEGIKNICQFSWVCEGKSTPPRNTTYIQAEAIAKQILGQNKWSNEIPSNVLFFHNTAVEPGWLHKRAMTIGNHVFYSKK